LTYYLILVGISFFVFLNLIIITAREYKLRLAEVNFLLVRLKVICALLKHDKSLPYFNDVFEHAPSTRVVK